MNPIEKLQLPLREILPSGKTLLFCHASFEPRSTAIVNAGIGGADIYQCFVLATKETHEQLPSYRDSASTLTSYFSENSDRPASLIVHERSSTVQWVDSIHSCLQKLSLTDIRNVVVDITTFPRDRLWTLIDYFARLPHALNVFTIYAEPDEYSTEKQDGWLSRGIRLVKDIAGFNGTQHTEKKSLLIVVMGREHDRPHLTISNREPDKVVLVARPNDQFKLDQRKSTNSILQRIFSEIHTEVVIWDSQVNPKEVWSTKQAILEISNKFENEFNISVASFGTKLQSLGVLLACRSNKDIQGIYAEPQTYNTNDYSEGTNSIWIIDLTESLQKDNKDEIVQPLNVSTSQSL